MTEQLAHRLAGEDGRVTFRTLVVACALTAFLTAVGATALAYAFAPVAHPVTRVVAVRTAQPGVRVARAAPPAGPAGDWALARAGAVAAADPGAPDQLDPSPPQILAGGAVVADDLVAPCATLTLAGAVARGLSCP